MDVCTNGWMTFFVSCILLLFVPSAPSPFVDSSVCVSSCTFEFVVFFEAFSSLFSASS